MNGMKTIIQDVFGANRKYFSNDIKSFFNDISYDVIQGDKGITYLLTHTNKWTDMFDGIKKPMYILHNLDQDSLKILDLIDEEFKTIEDVKIYLDIVG